MDKIAHIFFCIVLVIYLYEFIPIGKLKFTWKIIIASAIAFAIGLGWELIVNINDVALNYKDLIANIIGIVIGVILIIKFFKHEN